MSFVIRLSTSVLLILFIAGSLYFGSNLYFSVGVCVFSAIGVYEFLTMLRLRGVTVYRTFGVCMAVLIPWVVYTQYGITESGEVLFIVLSCFSLFLIQFARKEDPDALKSIALTFFGLMYIAWFLSYVIKIKFMWQGAVWIGYLITVTKVGDIFAYLIGSRWGKHSLIRHISPKKSIEGTIAGLAASGIVSVLMMNVLPLKFSSFHLLILGLVIGLVAQCGDLSESLIKRYCNAKDSGKLLPGMGGLLDLMDSVLFTMPLFYFYLKALTP